MSVYILLDFQHNMFGYVRLCKNKIEKLIDAIEKLTTINESIDFCDYGTISFDCLNDEDGNLVVGEINLDGLSPPEKNAIIRTIKYGYTMMVPNEIYREDLVNLISVSPAPPQLKTRMIINNNSVQWAYKGLDTEEKLSLEVLLPVLKTALISASSEEV